MAVSYTEASVDPSAVTGFAAALAAHGATGLGREIYLAAGRPEWFDDPPSGPLPEAAVAAIHAALHRLLPPDEARAYAREAGLRAGEEILAHRMTKAVRMVLRLMPAPIAAPLIVEAIAQHAAVFAGVRRFGHDLGPPLVLTLAGNPLATAPGCDWHAALFRRLFQSLVHESAAVRETTCCATGAAACRFEVTWRQARRPSPPSPAAA